MTTRLIGTTSKFPQADNSDYVGAATGGSLSGSNVLEVVYDDTVYTSSQEGKQRLVAAVEYLLERIKAAKTWPIDSTS